MTATSTTRAPDSVRLDHRRPDGRVLRRRRMRSRGPLTQLLARPELMHYHRLAATVLAVNVALVVHGGATGWFDSPAAGLQSSGNAVLANLALAVLIRQQYVVNLLFRLATMAPVTWPLRIRRVLGKVYHFGGLHVGGALAGTGWFVIQAGWTGAALITGSPGVSLVAALLTFALLAVLLLIVLTALPARRAARHDRFERVHRFGGWTALALFWALTLVSSPVSATHLVVLTVLTFSVALPWLRLRKVRVDAVRPSSHVVLAGFDYGVTPFPGSSTAISRHPLSEWHSFANIPAPGRSGFRLAVSRAGDWTGSFIDDLPATVWVKGIPTAGVANIEVLFRRVVYVATGSGLGPCLPHLLAAEVPSHLVWATRSPRETYGDELMDELFAVQPDATIWDTRAQGKPDLLHLAFDAYVATGAEAVICISNKKVTWDVVSGLERCGIPAYGAIWDS